MLNFCSKCDKMLYNGKINLTESMKKGTIIMNDKICNESEDESEDENENEDEDESEDENGDEHEDEDENDNKSDHDDDQQNVFDITKNNLLICKNNIDDALSKMDSKKNFQKYVNEINDLINNCNRKLQIANYMISR